MAHISASEAISAADTLLLTIPNQLGVEYCAHILDALLTQVTPKLGWRWPGATRTGCRTQPRAARRFRQLPADRTRR